MIPSHLFRAINSSRSDVGSAVVGFAIGAPIIALIATYAIGFAGQVWSRNVAVDIVRSELHQYAIHALERNAAAEVIRDRLSAQGLLVQSITWPNSSYADRAELQVTYVDTHSDFRDVFTISEVAFLE